LLQPCSKTKPIDANVSAKTELRYQRIVLPLSFFTNGMLDGRGCAPVAGNAPACYG
jgi:hypothetical protein